MKPQFIRSPSGDELVVLSRAEYDALILAAEPDNEDAEDIAIFDERMAELASGLSERLPPEVSAAMLRGDSLLKAVRNWRGLTQAQLALQAGLGQGYVSDLEAGRRKGTKETIAQIARVLDVDERWLIE